MKVKVCFEEHVEDAVLGFRAVNGGEKQHIVGLGGNCLLCIYSLSWVLDKTNKLSRCLWLCDNIFILLCIMKYQSIKNTFGFGSICKIIVFNFGK